MSSDASQAHQAQALLSTQDPQAPQDPQAHQDSDVQGFITTVSSALNDSRVDGCGACSSRQLSTDLLWSAQEFTNGASSWSFPRPKDVQAAALLQFLQEKGRVTPCQKCDIFAGIARQNALRVSLQ